MISPSDYYVVQATEIIGFACGSCGAWQTGENTLENLGEDIGGEPVESDRIDCTHCGQENYVFLPA